MVLIVETRYYATEITTRLSEENIRRTLVFQLMSAQYCMQQRYVQHWRSENELQNRQDCVFALVANMSTERKETQLTHVCHVVVSSLVHGLLVNRYKLSLSKTQISPPPSHQIKYLSMPSCMERKKT